jgi:hypothetical protein
MSATKLRQVRQKAHNKSEGDDQYARLESICDAALQLEGALAEFSARAAIAELASNWYQAIRDNDRKGSDMPSPERLAQTDIPLVVERLQHILEEHTQTE